MGYSGIAVIFFCYPVGILEYSANDFRNPANFKFCSIFVRITGQAKAKKKNGRGTVTFLLGDGLLVA